MSDKNIWKNPADIKKAVKAYTEKDYEAALHLIFENEKDEEIAFMDTGDMVESQMDIMFYALNKKHATAPATQALQGISFSPEIDQKKKIEWFKRNSDYITDKEAWAAYNAAKESFTAYCDNKHLALVTPNQSTYHATEKAMCEQLFKEYRVEFKTNQAAR